LAAGASGCGAIFDAGIGAAVLVRGCTAGLSLAGAAALVRGGTAGRTMAGVATRFLRGSSTGCDTGLAIGLAIGGGGERMPPPRGALAADCVSANVRAIAETAASADLRIVRLLMDTGLSSGRIRLPDGAAGARDGKASPVRPARASGLLSVASATPCTRER
jgi:hypothetical protein